VFRYHIQRYNSPMRKYGLIAILLAAALAGSFYVRGHSHHAIPTAPSEQKDSVPGPMDLPTRVVEELAALKPGITVAGWRRSHPTDEWHAPTYRDDREYWPFIFGDFCEVASLTEHLPNGHDLVRKAAFYIPAPPAPMALPSDRSASSLLDTCTLGYIQIELKTETKDGLAALSANVHTGLTTRFGPPVDEPNAMVLVPVLRRQIIPVWKVGDAKAVVGSVLQRLPTDPQYSDSQFAAYAYLPVFSFEREHPDEPYDLMMPENSPEIFQLAVGTTALDPKISQPTTDLYRKWIEFYRRKSALPYQEQPGLPRPIQPSEVASVLQPWLDATRKMPAQRRAAALLAAQFVVEASWSEFSSAARFSIVEKGSDAQRALEAAGAEFGPPGGPEGIQPVVKWVREARDIDPDGAIGDAITLMTLSGWHFRELFSGGYGDVTDYVIAVGEKYLLRPRDSATTAKIEYFIASAYCDRVLISLFGDDGGEGEVMPPTQAQLVRGAAAKPEALKHYQSMLALDQKSQRAIAAWRSGWRLMAELPVFRHYSLAGE
jgi:hypothetical protein